MGAPAIRVRQDGDDLLITFERTRKSQIAKLDEDRHLVFGWANVCVRCSGEQIEDAHGDMIDPEDLETAAYNFVLDFGETGEHHAGVAKGRLIESMFFTPEKLKLLGLNKSALPTGWWVGFHVEDNGAWQRVKRGDHRMFSIQGVGIREEAD